MTGKSTKRFDVALEPEVIALYQGGEPTVRVARRFGISDTTVRSILRRNGLVASHFRKKVSEEHIEMMLTLYREGKTTKEIAAELSVVRGMSCSPGTVSKLLRKAGVPLRPSTKRLKLSLAQRMELAERYASGEIMEALQRAYGVSSTVVVSCLDEFGVKHRTSWGKFQTPPWVDARGRRWVFKSRWELAYAQHLDAQGRAWDYEARKFGLRACACYTPDFVVEVGGVDEYHEVKGWLDDRTIARMQEFVRTYPARRLVLVGPRELVALGLIEGWYAQHAQAERCAAMRDWLDTVYRHAHTCARRSEVICGGN